MLRMPNPQGKHQPVHTGSAPEQLAWGWLVPRMYHACTWLAPPNPLPSTWLVPGSYLALDAFLLSAFYFLLWPCGGFVGALGWLWGRIGVPISWLSTRFGVALKSHWGGLRLACPAFPGSMSEVGCWLFSVFHKPSEYNSPPGPPWGWSGGGLVPPWTYPGTIGPPPNPAFDQP